MNEYTQTDQLMTCRPLAAISLTMLAATTAIVLAFTGPASANEHMDVPIHSCNAGKGHSPETEVPAPTATSKAADAVNALASRPSIVSRTQWGCSDGQSSPLWPAQYTTVTHLIVHHSATANSSSDWAAVVRSIFSYHRNDRGWGDIGYNYLIDPDGVIYEGRAGGDNVIGAHFSCVNGGTMGVCLLGTFDSVLPTQAAWDSLAALLAWKCDQRGLDPEGSAYHSNSQLTLPRICGHRDGNSSPVGCPSGTVCPGSQLYSALDSIRSDVAALLDGDDTTDPTMENYDASPTSIALGESFVLSFTASDDGGSGLDFCQVWWSTDDGGSPDDGNWSQYGSDISLSSHGSGPVNVKLTITPPAGTYWFGVHLNDQAGNYTTETQSGSGPEKVTVSASAPSLSYRSHRIDDDDPDANNDGVANPGEVIDLHITIRNGGGAMAHNIEGVISTTSAYVNITDPDRTWNDLAPGAEGEQTGDFDFEVADDCPDGHTATISMTITSDEGTWTDSFTIQVQHPPDVVDLTFAGVTPSDNDSNGRGNSNGVVDAGEEIDIVVELANTGTADATGVSATLSCSDPYVVISDDYETWPSIAAGATEACNADFDYSLLNGCPVGHMIEFVLSVTSDQQNTTIVFQMNVSGALPIAPLRILSFDIEPGALDIEFTSEVMGTYEIRTSTDLEHWTTLVHLNERGRPISSAFTVTGSAVGTNDTEFIRVLQIKE